MNIKVSSWVSYVALCFALAALSTCGGGGSGSGEVSGNTGTVAMTLHLGDHQALGLAQIDCGTSGIDAVQAQIYDEANTLIASGGPWPCLDHEGTITEVPAECSLTVVGLGTGIEIIPYLGESVPFCVTAGETTSVEITLRPFASPTRLSPTYDYCFRPPCSYTFSWSSDWERHEFELDNDSDFSSPLTSAVVSGTSCQASVPGTGTYYWRVRATDSTGNHYTDWSSVTFFASP